MVCRGGRGARAVGGRGAPGTEADDGREAPGTEADGGREAPGTEADGAVARRAPRSTGAVALRAGAEPLFPESELRCDQDSTMCAAGQVDGRADEAVAGRAAVDKRCGLALG